MPGAAQATPATRLGVWAGRQMVRILTRLPGQEMLMRPLFKAVNGIDLPDYRMSHR